MLRLRQRNLARRSALVSVLLSVLCLGLAACVAPRGWNNSTQKTHVVRSGETLFIIANRYGKDHRSLARWNGLGDGTLIYPGQVIQLGPRSTNARPVGARETVAKRAMPAPPADPPPGWTWPTSGRITGEYTGSKGSGTGLVISGRTGQAVRAAADGKVVYSGGGLIGYGQLIILKHNNTYLSAYGYNASVLVKEGDSIKKGQRIATMGGGPGNKAQLHFEIRRNGTPVNPRQFLPRL